MTPFDVYFTALCMLGGWIIGATIADPNYTTDGLRGLWAAWVDMFRHVRRLVSRI